MAAHLAGEVDPDDLQFEKRGWKPLYAYKRDKALNRIVSKVLLTRTISLVYNLAAELVHVVHQGRASCDE